MLGGQALGLIVINLVLTFAIPNISIGGHVGGLAGGALSMLALSRFGRTHAIYGRPGSSEWSASWPSGWRACWSRTSASRA